jgi:uncharacterized protein
MPMLLAANYVHFSPEVLYNSGNNDVLFTTLFMFCFYLQTKSIFVGKEDKTMASTSVTECKTPAESVRELTFAGDDVCLAGQIDYPDISPPFSGYPLLFLLHNSGWCTRDKYDHYAETALSCGYAVFRWDKRGTGNSGAGGRGSTTQDSIMAYKTAINQPLIDKQRVVILALGEGSLMLGHTFELFNHIQHPHGAILAGNMLDSCEILAIDTTVQVVMAENDWNDWQQYADEACERHNESHNHGASFYIAPDANRMLMVKTDGGKVFHNGAGNAIYDWLQAI